MNLNTFFAKTGLSLYETRECSLAFNHEFVQFINSRPTVTTVGGKLGNGLVHTIKVAVDEGVVLLTIDFDRGGIQSMLIVDLEKMTTRVVDSNTSFWVDPLIFCDHTNLNTRTICGAHRALGRQFKLLGDRYVTNYADFNKVTGYDVRNLGEYAGLTLFSQPSFVNKCFTLPFIVNGALDGDELEYVKFVNRAWRDAVGHVGAFEPDSVKLFVDNSFTVNYVDAELCVFSTSVGEVKLKFIDDDWFIINDTVFELNLGLAKNLAREFDEEVNARMSALAQLTE